MTRNRKMIFFILLSNLLHVSIAEDCICLDMNEDEFKTVYTNPDELSLLYNGQIKTFRMQNTMEIIETENNNMNTKYIDAKFENDNLTIFTTEAFKNYAKEQSSQKIVLTIELKCTAPSANARVTFAQNIKESNLYDPEFSKTEYRFSVPLPLYEGFDLSIFQEITAIDYDLYGNKITFTSSDNSIIEVRTKPTLDPNERGYSASLILKKPLLNITQSLQFTITATDSGNPPRHSTVPVIITANSTNSLPPQPNFEKALYEGNLGDDLKLTIEDVLLEKGTFSNDIEFLKDNNEDSGLFNINSNNDRVKIILAKNLTQNDVQGKTILKFILLARNPKAASDGRTAIVVKVPQKTSTIPNMKPIFDKAYYVFAIKSNFIGIIGKFSAHVTGSNTSVVLTYSLELTNENLKTNLQIDKFTGELKTTQTLASDIYTFKVLANNSQTGDVGEVEVSLFVENIDHSENINSVAKSLIVMHLDEGEIHKDFLDTQINNCTLKIVSTDPNDREYFIIDEHTHKMSSVILDREDIMYSKMIIPQIQVKLILQCPDKKYSLPEINQNISSAITSFEGTSQSSETTYGKRSYVLTEDIDYSPFITMMNVIIEDINDNAPEFIFPPESFVIGYPESKITDDLLNRSLIQIHAIDKDIGLNAKIRYDISSNNDFSIEPETGVIYPFSNALKQYNTITFTVFATDRDGAKDGNKVSRNVTITKLLSSEVIVVTFINQRHDTFDDILKSLKNKTQLDFRILKYGIVPSDEIESQTHFSRIRNLFRSSEEVSIILKAWLYVLNSENQPQKSDDIKKKILQINPEFDVKASTYDEIKRLDSNSSSNNSTGYLVVIIIISILLVIIAGFLIWWFCIRHQIIRFIKMSSSSNAFSISQRSLNSENENLGETNKKSTSSSLSPNGNLQESSNVGRQIQHNESLRTILKDANDNKPRDGEINGCENRKSIVTFDEHVKRIDIKTDYDRDEDDTRSVRL